LLSFIKVNRVWGGLDNPVYHAPLGLRPSLRKPEGDQKENPETGEDGDREWSKAYGGTNKKNVLLASLFYH
jgi:hypothetical protein